MKLRYTRPALADLDEILQYIADRSPNAAVKVQARLRDVIELLSVYPRMGAVTVDPDIRRVVATPYPYLVFYELAGDEVIIHAVRHGARDPESMP